MNDSGATVDRVEAMLRDFWQTFYSRPEMHGSPDELNAMFFYLDQVEFLMLGGAQSDYWECSWMAFLIERRLIVGARNLLGESLREGTEGYVQLQSLRREYLVWRSAKGRWPERPG